MGNWYYAGLERIFEIIAEQIRVLVDALPEAMEQARDDLQNVADALERIAAEDH